MDDQLLNSSSDQVMNVLAASAAVIEHLGWVSKMEARERDCAPTAYLVDRCLHGDYSHCWPVTRAHYALAVEAREWVDFGDHGQSEYMDKCKAVCGRSTVADQDFNLLVSVMGSYKRHLERKVRADAEALRGANSEHVGSVGSRVEMTLTLVDLREIETMFGLSTKLEFLDPDGNVVLWWASNPYILDNKRRVPDVGETVRVKATVKGHSQYKGVKQTTVNRLVALPALAGVK